MFSAAGCNIYSRPESKLSLLVTCMRERQGPLNDGSQRPDMYPQPPNANEACAAYEHGQSCEYLKRRAGGILKSHRPTGQVQRKTSKRGAGWLLAPCIRPAPTPHTHLWWSRYGQVQEKKCSHTLSFSRPSQHSGDNFCPWTHKVFEYNQQNECRLSAWQSQADQFQCSRKKSSPPQ